MAKAFKLTLVVFFLLHSSGFECRESFKKSDDDDILNNFFNKQVEYWIKDLKLTIGEKIHLEITSKDDNAETKLQGKLGIEVPQDKEPAVYINDKSINLSWGQKLSLKIIQSEISKCHTIRWTSDLDSPLKDCFRYGTANWFGGPELDKQQWPIEKLHFKEVPYVTQMFGNIAKIEPYWLNSKGVYLYVDPKTPLFIDSNDYKPDNLCFIANNVAPYLKSRKKVLEYDICSLSDSRTAHEHAIENFLGKPSGIPDVRMVEHPVWSTWVRYHANVNETIVMQFAEEIVENGFSNSQIEIDDNWETCYGSTKFNTARFPSMKELSGKLKSLGFRVTIWVHPFINSDCPLHSELSKKGYLVQNFNGSDNSVWWNGAGSSIDFTNPDAVEWFKNNLKQFMRENDIDGLKFDAGETSWLPQIPILKCPDDEHPNAYTRAYIDAISHFNKLTELRVSYRSQQYPMFVRMIDKDSRWTLENGLPTLITTMLVMNMQGHPWVLPDMVGGNAYGNDVIDKELLIRWLQANTFMPSIQFSAAPWDYDDETVEICKKFADLHYQYSVKIIELMKKTVRTGAPLNPPIWWIDPKNPTAHKIDSEYLLGEDILVAPILTKGAVRRDIYLPRGYWRDENHPQKVYKGRRWLKNYYAGLSTLPYFTKVQKSFSPLDSDNSNGEEDSETVFEN